MDTGYKNQDSPLISCGSVTVTSCLGIASAEHEVTHLGEIFTLLQKYLATPGRSRPTNENAVRLDLHAYTAQSISGILVDPHDGKRYELCLRLAAINPDHR